MAPLYLCYSKGGILRTTNCLTAYKNIFIVKVQERNSKSVRRCFDSTKEVNYGSVKRNHNFKRKRHIKKSFSHHIKDEHRTLDSNVSLYCNKQLFFDIMFNTIITIGVSFVSCGCFFALMSSLETTNSNSIHSDNSRIFQTVHTTKSHLDSSGDKNPESNIR